MKKRSRKVALDILPINRTFNTILHNLSMQSGLTISGISEAVNIATAVSAHFRSSPPLVSVSVFCKLERQNFYQTRRSSQ